MFKNLIQSIDTARLNHAVKVAKKLKLKLLLSDTTRPNLFKIVDKVIYK